MTDKKHDKVEGWPSHENVRYDVHHWPDEGTPLHVSGLTVEEIELWSMLASLMADDEDLS